MNRVIKDYSRLHSSKQEEVYMAYSEGDLERTSFPYKGQIVDGVICQLEDTVYLIPISTIVAGKSGYADDLDDEDDGDSSEMDDELEDTDEE